MTSYFLTFFAMDIHQMTPVDWAGVIIHIAVFAALIVAYVKTFHPVNKQNLEAHRYHLIEHDRDVPHK